MKKLFIFVAVCLMSATTAICGQTHTQSISFDDGVGPGNSGTYNSTDSFSVDLYLTFNGYSCYGLSLWMQTTANAAPHISLTSFTYGTTFDDPTQPFATFPLNFTLADGNGMFTTPNPSDLGATVLDPHGPGIAPGTYFVGHLTISLSGLAPGVYVLQTDATGGHASVATSGGPNPPFFFDEFIPVSQYTITVIPEPSSLLLLACGGLVAFVVSYRKMRFIQN